MIQTARKKSLASLVLLAVLVCLTGVTGAALVAVQYTEWDWLSLLLGAVLILLVTALVWVVLDAVDNWIDRAERQRTGDEP
jgi:uncharacterized membrane protein